MNESMKQSLITVKDAAEMLKMPESRVYQRVMQCRRRQEVTFDEGDHSFFIYRTSSRVLLLPVDWSAKDLESLENKAAAACLDKLLPCLCPDCASAVAKIKAVYESD